jgi:hypothetical protein
MYPLIQVQENCAYSSPADGWNCSEPVWLGSRSGFCIGHSPEPNKPKDAFITLIQNKLRSQDYSFDGFVFPSSLTIRNISTSKIVSFRGCKFLQGVRFENVQVDGSVLSFEDCIFGGSILYFHRCGFNASNVTFAQSAFDGDLLAFHRCQFEGEHLDFSNIKWRASKRITYVFCSFKNGISSYNSAQLKAPSIIYRGGSIGSNDFAFRKSNINSDCFSFQDVKQTKGRIAFENSILDCKTTEFSQSEWDGQILFKKNRWNGDKFSFGSGNVLNGDLLIEHCRFNGSRVDLSGLECYGGDLTLSKNHFLADEIVDFSGVLSNQTFSVSDCEFKSDKVLFERLKTNGDSFLFLNNIVRTQLFSCRDSEFNSKRVSFNRSEFEAASFNFCNCLFKNIQTSFQGMKVKGRESSFQNTKFLSGRVSFQLSDFDVDLLNMESVDFGTGKVSFWNTSLGKSFNLKRAHDEGARLRFVCGMDNVIFDGVQLTNCNFNEAVWKYTGWLKRPSVSNESQLIKLSRYSELRELYQWISGQYDKSGNYKKRDDFMYACREIERLERFHNGAVYDFIQSEFSRWITGYGLGFSRCAFLKGFSSLFTLMLLMYAKTR